MKPNTLKLLSCSILLVIAISCKKGKLSGMDTGKYDMLHLIEWDNGQKDTIHCFVYGYFGNQRFHPELENDGAGILEIYPPRKKEKNYSELKSYIYLPGYPPYFYGQITDCKVTKRSINLTYKGRQVPFSGSIQINWVEL